MYAGVPVGALHHHGRPPQVNIQELAAAQQRLSSQPLLAPKPPSSGPMHPLLPPQPHIYPHAEASTRPISYKASEPSFLHFHVHGDLPPVPDIRDSSSQGRWAQQSVAAVNLSTEVPNSSPEVYLYGQSGTNSVARPQAIVDEDLTTLKQDPARFDELHEWEFEDYRQDELMDDSDEENSSAGAMTQLRGPQVGVFVAHMLRNPHDPHDTLPRYFEASPFTSMATYDPEPSQSPLNDEQIRAVFSHFIRVTGPSISMYERHSHDIGVMANGQQLTRAKRHIWTCKSSPTRILSSLNSSDTENQPRFQFLPLPTPPYCKQFSHWQACRSLA